MRNISPFKALYSLLWLENCINPPWGIYKFLQALYSLVWLEECIHLSWGIGLYQLLEALYIIVCFDKRIVFTFREEDISVYRHCIVYFDQRIVLISREEYISIYRHCIVCFVEDCIHLPWVTCISFQRHWLHTLIWFEVCVNLSRRIISFSCWHRILFWLGPCNVNLLWGIYQLGLQALRSRLWLRVCANLPWGMYQFLQALYSLFWLEVCFNISPDIYQVISCYRQCMYSLFCLGVPCVKMLCLLLSGPLALAYWFLHSWFILLRFHQGLSANKDCETSGTVQKTLTCD